jgi:hypothetical protein
MQEARLDPSRQGGRVGEVGVEKQGREIEAALADQPLRIDREPTSPEAEVEDVVVVKIAMKNRDFPFRGQQVAHGGKALVQEAATGGCSGLQIPKPIRKRQQIGVGLAARSVQAGSDRT